MRAEANSEGEAWRIADVLTFASDHERQPQTHRELFGLTLARLDDLKLDLERGDSSNASILLPIKEETEHRKYIGNWLRDRARGRYVVPQEEELADKERPDIRIHGSGFDGPVPLELMKVADNWSGAYLFERLENQLIGDYLRDDRSSCGDYLLVNRGTKNWDHPITKAKLDFNQLLLALQSVADFLLTDQSSVEAVQVMGLDLTTRNCLPM